MRNFTAGILAGCLFAVSAPIAAQAEVEITRLEGEVLANRGTGFLPVLGRRTLHAGDRILINPSARIALRWPDGCRIELANARVLSVPRRSPCAFKANNPASAGQVAGAFAGANSGAAAAGGAATIASTIGNIAGTIGVTAASLAISAVGVAQAQREASKEKTRNTVSVP